MLAKRCGIGWGRRLGEADVLYGARTALEKQVPFGNNNQKGRGEGDESGAERGGEAVEGEVAEEVAAESGPDLVERVGRAFYPGESGELGETVEIGAEIDVADELGRSGFDQEEVFEEESEGAEEGSGLFLAFGSGSIVLGHAEERRMIGVDEGGVEEDEGVGAGGGVGREVEGEGAAGGALCEAGDEGALRRRQIGAAVAEEHLELFDGKSAEAEVGAARADGGKELGGVLGEEEEVDGRGRLLEDLEEGVRGLLHERGGREDEDTARCFGGLEVRALDDGTDLTELDEELRRIGRDDEDVGVRLDKDAGVFLIGFAEVFAGGDGFGDAGGEVGGGADAGAVGTGAAEVGEGLTVGPEVAWLAEALEGHGEHEGEGVFAGSARAGEDEGVWETAGGDSGAEGFDDGGVADEVGEGGRKDGV